jgi:transposase
MRYELSDCEWSVVKPMLPNKPRGIPRVDDRRVLNGIFWTLRSGAPWRDLPEVYVAPAPRRVPRKNHRWLREPILRAGVESRRLFPERLPR